MNPATIFDVQRFCLHDGPGIRTVVFFKGCTLRCVFCQNPESIDPRPEMAFYPERCIECRACLDVCPRDAIREGDVERIDWSSCDACGRCAALCPAEALRQIGRRVSASQLLAEVLADRAFFDSSGGGLTLSGGEPVLQSDFLAAFLPLCKTKGLHVLLETAGNYRFEKIERLLEWIDELFFDFKFPDSASYERYSGSHSRHIEENLERLAARQRPRLTVRIPLIPGLNTTDDRIDAFAARLRQLGIARVALLDYNHLWEAKLPRLHTERKPLRLHRDQVARQRIEERFRFHAIGVASN
ncbi:MAG: glycyl-radical enzyme activating protein [Myxococcales bacterium]|nr:glycyl-radical enzyme activating protein [Myxococcales bacterium]